MRRDSWWRDFFLWILQEITRRLNSNSNSCFRFIPLGFWHTDSNYFNPYVVVSSITQNSYRFFSFSNRNRACTIMTRGGWISTVHVDRKSPQLPWQPVNTHLKSLKVGFLRFLVFSTPEGCFISFINFNVCCL